MFKRSFASLAKNTHWKQLTVEILSIIVGVLIALAMDEWNENRQNHNKAEQALTNIRLELNSNLKILEYLHPENLHAVDVLQNDEESSTDSLRILPGLQLQETAWITFMSTGVSAFIPYDELYDVAELYTIIRIYKEVGTRFINFYDESRSLHSAMGREIEDDDIIRSNLSILVMLVSVEEQLIDHIKTYLEIETTED